MADERTERRVALEEVVRDVLIDDLKVRVDRADLAPDTPLFGTGLGLDSVDAVDLVVGIEQRTGTRVPDDERGRVALRTIGHLVELLLGDAPEWIGAADDVPADVAALRYGVAVSDGSQVAVVRVSGDGAFDLLDGVSPRPLFARDGQVLHTLLLTHAGTPWADLYVCVDDLDYVLLAEGPTASELAAWLVARGVAGARVSTPDVVVRQLHGPYAWELMSDLFGNDVVGVQYLTGFAIPELGGHAWRAGKTGEFGYDLVVPRDRAAALDARLADAGARMGLAPVDVDLLDLCALENGFFSIRHPGARELSPFELQLAWRVDLHDRDWPGADALRERREEGITERIAWFCGPPGDRSAITGEVTHHGAPVGRVLGARWSPLLGAQVGQALVSLDAAHAGLTLDCDGRPLLVRSPPLLRNRSLFIDAQRHGWASRDLDALPPVVPA